MRFLSIVIFNSENIGNSACLKIDCTHPSGLVDFGGEPIEIFRPSEKRTPCVRFWLGGLPRPSSAAWPPSLHWVSLGSWNENSFKLERINEVDEMKFQGVLVLGKLNVHLVFWVDGTARKKALVTVANGGGHAERDGPGEF